MLISFPEIIYMERSGGEALQYLLSCTHEEEKPFAILEYEVFRYNVSNNGYKTLVTNLETSQPIVRSIDGIENHSRPSRIKFGISELVWNDIKGKAVKGSRHKVSVIHW